MKLQRLQRVPKTMFRARGNLLALETRTLFDGAAFATVEPFSAHPAGGNDGASSDAQATVQAAAERSPADARESTRRELLFVDTTVVGWQGIVASVRPGVEIVLLDPARDPLGQIVQRIGEGVPVDAVHILSLIHI